MKLTESDIIYENVIKKSIANQPIYVGELDFDAFDEDDILALIEDKFDNFNNGFSTLQHIISVISNMSAKPVKAKKFF